MKNFIIVVLAAALAFVGYLYWKELHKVTADKNAIAIVPGKDEISITYYGISVEKDSLARATGSQPVYEAIATDTYPAGSLCSDPAATNPDCNGVKSKDIPPPTIHDPKRFSRFVNIWARSVTIVPGKAKDTGK